MRLLAQPHLLLMDEPLASLDAARKSEIMPYLTRLKTALKLPILYVTHALDEVAQLADSMVLIEAGRVIGCGPLSEIAARADLPLAQRDDAGALLLCRVAEHDAGRELTRLEGGGATFWVPLLDAPLGAERRMRIPAREVILAGKPPDAISLHNIVPGERAAHRGRRGAAIGSGGDRVAEWRADLARHARRHRPAWRCRRASRCWR